jgi:hypothetical protein
MLLRGHYWLPGPDGNTGMLNSDLRYPAKKVIEILANLVKIRQDDHPIYLVTLIVHFLLMHKNMMLK